MLTSPIEIDDIRCHPVWPQDSDHVVYYALDWEYLVPVLVQCQRERALSDYDVLGNLSNFVSLFLVFR